MKFEDLKAKLSEYVLTLGINEKSNATIDAYKRDVNQFFDYLGKSVSDSDDVTKANVLAYKEDMKSQNRKTATINRKLISLNKFFNWAGASDLAGTKQIKQQHKTSLDDIISQKEYERLVDACLNPPAQAVKKGIRPDVRLHMILIVLANTGIRISELKFFTVEALKQSATTGDIVVYNKGKERRIPVHKELQKALKDYCEKLNIKSGIIFCTANGTVISNAQLTRKMKTLAGYLRINKSKVHCHAFRHLFGKTYMQDIGRIDELADILGHADISTTRIYSRTSSKEKGSNIEKLGLMVNNKKKQ